MNGPVVAPIVSVCMITYNHELFIKQAIECVLMQQCSFNFELVIGEDNSNDNTREICTNLAAKNNNIRLLPSGANLGMIHNFFRTLQTCTGKYISVCEGDDFWNDPLKLQKQVDFLESHPDYGLVYGRVLVLDRNGELKPNNLQKISTFEELLKGNYIPTVTTCFKGIFVNEYLLKNREIAENWSMGDYPLWLWISLNSKIFLMDETFATYRHHEGSATDFKDFKKREKFIKSTIEIKKYFYSFYKGPLTKSQILKNDYGRLCLTSIKHHKFLKFLKFFLYNPMQNLLFLKDKIWR